MHSFVLNIQYTKKKGSKDNAVEIIAPSQRTVQKKLRQDN